MSAILVERWKFPQHLVESIRNHHSLELISEPSLLERVVFVANQVSKLLDHDEPENKMSRVETIPGYIEQWLGIPIEEVPGTLDDLPSELEKAKAYLDL